MACHSINSSVTGQCAVTDNVHRRVTYGARPWFNSLGELYFADTRETHHESVVHVLAGKILVNPLDTDAALLFHQESTVSVLHGTIFPIQSNSYDRRLNRHHNLPCVRRILALTLDETYSSIVYNIIVSLPFLGCKSHRSTSLTLSFKNANMQQYSSTLYPRSSARTLRLPSRRCCTQTRSSHKPARGLHL